MIHGISNIFKKTRIKLEGYTKISLNCITISGTTIIDVRIKDLKSKVLEICKELEEEAVAQLLNRWEHNIKVLKVNTVNYVIISIISLNKDREDISEKIKSFIINTMLDIEKEMKDDLDLTGDHNGYIELMKYLIPPSVDPYMGVTTLS